mmetsp:Transcript_6475/g.7873  ORF Transcript_6475/g.7873 Transcript_6475/m.7873 type:complete len:340 (+) Transcript_6475:239-1258(+)
MLGVANLRAVSGRQLFDIHIIGNEPSTDMAPNVVPNFAPGDDEIPNLDILFIPGGNGWMEEMKMEATVAWLEKAVKQAKLVLSVCNGVGFLCSIGVLNGKRATTNKIDLRELQAQFSLVDFVEEARWVDDGKFYTSSGISAGTDMVLHLLSQMFSPELADKVAHFAEYEPIKSSSHDPFVTNVKGFKHQIDNCQPETPVNSLKVGLLLYDNFELFDTFGPLEMFACANRTYANGSLFSLITLAETRYVRASKGPQFEVSHPYFLNDQTEDILDILFIPGGIGTIREVNNEKLLKWVKIAAEKATLVFTVCSGSAILAKAGSLDGKQATTNKLMFHEMTR